MFYSSSEIFHYTCCLILLICGTVCGVIRWFHMCRPYDKQEHIFYPARKQVAATYVWQLLLFPYLLFPQSDFAWLLARSFSILYYPICCSLLLLYYFHGNGIKNRGEWRVIIGKSAIYITSITLTTLFLLSFIKNSYSELRSLILPAVWISGLIAQIFMLFVLRWMKRQMDDYNQGNFSNPNDFPYRFALHSTIESICFLFLFWFVFLSDSRTVFAISNIICAAYEVYLLVTILNPQRGPEIEEMKNICSQDSDTDNALAISDSDNDSSISLSPDKKQQILNIIYKELYLNQGFLNQHLTQAELANIINSNRTYIYITCNEYFGGFCNMVNLFRLMHAQEYISEHPHSSQEEIAAQCGFTSRQTYKYMHNKLKDKLPAFITEYSNRNSS